MNCFIFAGSGIPPSPQHCFIISSIFIGLLLPLLDGRVMRLGADWPPKETEAHHLSLFAKMGQGLLHVCGSAADGKSILLPLARTHRVSREPFGWRQGSRL
jgi:hypothetical protein